MRESCWPVAPRPARVPFHTGGDRTVATALPVLDGALVCRTLSLFILHSRGFEGREWLWLGA